jgi:hypothetical protein
VGRGVSVGVLSWVLGHRGMSRGRRLGSAECRDLWGECRALVVVFGVPEGPWSEWGTQAGAVV